VIPETGIPYRQSLPAYREYLLWTIEYRNKGTIMANLGKPWGAKPKGLNGKAPIIELLERGEI
jgi:hypothetical protein